MTPRAVAHYRIGAKLGAGAMGEVYRALDTRLKREVAIKILPEEFARDRERMARFQREAEVLGSLNHPNIAHIYGVEERALVMELVEGESPKGPLPFEDAWKISSQIADALEYAHARGIVHRDLKPANVKVTPEGVVKLLDFGLAKAFGDPAEAPTVDPADSPTTIGTSAGTVLGTAAYMAPEQTKGKRVDKRADIWSWGVVLYELLAGSSPFRGETITETLAAVLRGEPDWSRIEIGVQPLLRACLEKDPNRRLHDIADSRLLVEVTPETAAAKASRSYMGRVFAGLFLAALIALVFTILHFRAQPSTAQSMRFTIPLPEGLSVGQAGRGAGFAVSPDGRSLAFVAIENGRMRIWIRDMDTLQARVLADSDLGNGRAPFWSPDSRFLAFDSGGRLKKIDVAGGPALTICELTEPVLGGSWNADDIIIFGTASGVKRVPAAGGTITAVTAKAASGELAHAFPFFLPDGKHFLYARITGLGTGGIFAGTLESKPEEQNARQLFNSGFEPIYVPAADGRAGRVLFVRQGVLLAQSFDARSLQPTGEPSLVADRVAISGAYSLFSASANGHLIYRAGQNNNLKLTWFDRQGRMTGSLGEPGRYSFVAISPDGTRAAVSRVDAQTGNSDLWLTEFASGTSSRLTFDPATLSRSAAWSPDSRQIVFLANRDGVNGLYQKATNGAGSEELLVKGPGIVINQWSHDGKYLLFGIADPKTRNDLSLLPTTGDRHPVPILRTSFDETGGRISPDGRWIAYRSNESGKNELYVQPFVPQADFATTAAGGKWMVSRGSLGMARWRDDSKELYYLAPDGKVMAVQITANPAFHAASPEALFQVPSAFLEGGAYPGTMGDVTGDGKRFLFALPFESATREEFTVLLNWQSALKR